MIVKTHRSHPGMAEIAGHCIQQAALDTGMPEGVFSSLHGGREIGRALVEHRCIQKVGFIGSRTGGVALMQYAASRPHPIQVFAEMSSVNPVVILPEALRDGNPLGIMRLVDGVDTRDQW